MQVSSLPRGSSPCSSNPHFSQVHNYAVLETTRVTTKNFRRVDSCGTLDSTLNHTTIRTVDNVDTLTNAFRRVDSCGTVETNKRSNLPMTKVEGTEGKNNQYVSHHDTRQTKSPGMAAWNMQMRDRKSPPILARQPSPLVTTQEEPVYHVLQQPGSPVYRVLESPSPGGPRSPDSYNHFQHKTFTFTEQATAKTLTPSSSQHRPSGPLNRCRENVINPLSCERIEGHSDHIHQPMFRQVTDEVSPMRSEIVPTDFRPESLV